MRIKLVFIGSLLFICISKNASGQPRKDLERWIIEVFKSHTRTSIQPYNTDSSVYTNFYHFEFSKYYLTMKYQEEGISYKTTESSKAGSTGKSGFCSVLIPVDDIYSIDYIKSSSILLIQLDKTFTASFCDLSNTPIASKILSIGFDPKNEKDLVGKLNIAFSKLKKYYRSPTKKQ